MRDTLQKTLDTAVEDDPASSVHRVSHDIYTDPEIFELEPSDTRKVLDVIVRPLTA
jgi:hypothetical protein